MKVRSYLTLLLLLLGVAAWGQKTYKLEQVTSVESLVADAMYVFEQDGYVMNNTISSGSLQTVNNYKESGLTGYETYIWQLTNVSNNCFSIRNKYRTSSQGKYLNYSSKTSLSFGKQNESNGSWEFVFQNDGSVLIQNPKNDNRYLGYQKGTHDYKAYSTDNMTYPHAIKVYKLVEEKTKLYIHTGRDDENKEWKPYIWAWKPGTTGVDLWNNDWYHKPQTTESETINGILWHTITVPSGNFYLILNNGYPENINQTPTIGPLTSDTFILFNLGEGSDVYNREGYKDYVIVDFADIKAENLYLLPGETAGDVVSNNNNAGVTLSYANDNTEVATFDEEANNVTGVSKGVANITISWPNARRTDDIHRGWVSGSTSFEVYVARSIDLNEGVDNATIISGAQNERLTVNLYRQLTANMWNAICLPFDMDDAKIKALFGDGYKLRSFSEVEKDGANVTLKFAKATTLEAGVPYIVLPTKTVERDAVVVISDVTLTNADPKKVTFDGYTFQGIYAPKSFTKGDKSIRFIGSGNKFYYPNSANPMRAFRAYFTLPAGTTEAKVGMSFDEDMGVATGIVAVDGGAVDGRIYSMSGQYVGTSTQGLPRGLYIRDGRKFVVK